MLTSYTHLLSGLLRFRALTAAESAFTAFNYGGQPVRRFCLRLRRGQTTRICINEAEVSEARFRKLARRERAHYERAAASGCCRELLRDAVEKVLPRVTARSFNQRLSVIGARALETGTRLKIIKRIFAQVTNFASSRRARAAGLPSPDV